MSNEITWTGNFSVTNGKYSDKWSIGNSQIDQGSVGASSGVVTTSTSEVDVPIGSVTSVGFLLLCNLSDDDNVDFGINVDATFQPVGTLLPSENAIFRVKTGVTIQLKAQSNTPAVQFLLLQA